MKTITIAGAGLAGLSAALTCAEHGAECVLISVQPSERAQSVLAEGGMNAALNTMGEDDAPRFHYEDTMKGGAFLSDPNAVKGLTDAAPEVIQRLWSLGVPFQMKGDGLMLRPFGGQKKRRTAYAFSSTGKAVMNALIDEVRKYEAAGLIHRYSSVEILEPLTEERDASGAEAWGIPYAENRASGKRRFLTGLLGRDIYSGGIVRFSGPVILCTGGMNALFSGMTTGSASNTGDLTAAFFEQGVQLGNMEMLQYHPSTTAICGKRLLISEAARGEGGRLFIRKKDGSGDWYFMEEKYPELKNLMPRDVVSREMFMAVRDPACGDQVYLDMRGLKKETWEGKLKDLREEVIHYLKLDPAEEPVPVSPGIHFFMGGILVDEHHRSSMPLLWAAGECACQYHGANRLGGNSMLAAVYGGHTACEDALEYLRDGNPGAMEAQEAEPDRECSPEDIRAWTRVRPVFEKKLTGILAEGLGIYRDERTLARSLERLEKLEAEAETLPERRRAMVGRAMLSSALARKESRGAHSRTDFPERNDDVYRRTTVSEYKEGRVEVCFRNMPPLR